MAGAYVATRLVFSSFAERLDNQLLGAGKVANKTILDQEIDRLTVLRNVGQTAGLSEALVANDLTQIQGLVVPIASNSPHIDSIVLLSTASTEVLKLNRSPQNGNDAFLPIELGSGLSYLDWDTVDQVLRDEPTELGDKHTVLAQDESNTADVVYSVGPVRNSGEVVGVVLVGTYLGNVLDDIKLQSLADITFYDSNGRVRATTFPGRQTGISDLLDIDPEYYNAVLQGDGETQKESVSILGDEFILAFTPFQLRGETLGVFSVGLSSDFVISSGVTSRNLFSFIVFFAITVLLIIAYIVTQQIIRPLARLVRTSGEIAAGNFDVDTGIVSHDEIGHLATSFSQMAAELRKGTEQLEELVRLREEDASTLRAILSSIADGVLVQDKDGNVLERNPAAERILENMAHAFHLQPDPADETGYRPIKEISLDVPAQAAEGNGIRPFLPEGERPRRFNIGNQAISTSAAPVINKNNENLGSVVILRDISWEFELDQLKRRFIEAISHELLTPITPIRGFIDYLKMISQDETYAKHLNLIEKVDANVDALQDLISTLIDVSQIEAGDFGLDLQTFDLNELVADVAESYQEKMQEKELTFEVNVLDSYLMVNGDKKRLRRVLRALLGNALSYNRPQGSVSLAIQQVGDYVRVDVTDTGLGIADSLRPYIFNTLFVRGAAHGPDTNRGAGAQLYIAWTIIDQHGGKIWFNSKLNHGSTFSFTIPLLNETG